MEKVKKFPCLRKKYLYEIKYLKKLAAATFQNPEDNGNLMVRCGYFTILGLMSFTAFQLLLTLSLEGFSSLSNFTNIAPNFGITMTALTRFLDVHNNRIFFNKLMNHFCNDFWMNLSIDDKDIVTKFFGALKLLDRIFLTHGLVLTGIVISSPFIVGKFEEYYFGEKPKFLLPYGGWYPFDVEDWYPFIYAWEGIATASVILPYIYSTILNIFCVTSICMELRILGNSIENFILEEDVDETTMRLRGVGAQKLIKNNVKQIIFQYNFILELCAGLNNYLGHSMLIYYVFGSILMCLTAFTFTVEENVYMKIRYFSFFLAVLIEILDHCVLGEVLKQHYERLSGQIYHSHWIYADHDTKRIIMMFLFRSQKPITLTAKGFVDMDLITFSKIMTTFYRYFNLLRTVHE